MWPRSGGSLLQADPRQREAASPTPSSLLTKTPRPDSHSPYGDFTFTSNKFICNIRSNRPYYSSRQLVPSSSPYKKFAITSLPHKQISHRHRISNARPTCKTSPPFCSATSNTFHRVFFHANAPKASVPAPVYKKKKRKAPFSYKKRG
jgi:hypothetical protein